jgi:hypothetical protein
MGERVDVRLQFTVYVFQFFGGGFNLSRNCAGLCAKEVGKRIMCGVCCSPVGSAGFHGVSYDILCFCSPPENL